MVFALEEKSPSAVALLAEDGTRVTYGELCRQSESMKKIWNRRELVFCLCENSPGAVTGYIAALNNRIVPLMLDAGLGTDPLSQFYYTYRPDYIWAPLGQAERLQTLGCQKPVYTAYHYGLWKIPKSGFVQPAVHEKLALLLATSGSTGNPKLVRLSLENVESNAEAICSYLHLSEQERPIWSKTVLPEWTASCR